MSENGTNLIDEIKAMLAQMAQIRGRLQSLENIVAQPVLQAPTKREYVIYGGVPEDLEHYVTDAINDGWTLYGNPYAVNGIHYQAAIRHDPA